jgi:hypothetical protein
LDIISICIKNDFHLIKRQLHREKIIQNVWGT